MTKRTLLLASAVAMAAFAVSSGPASADPVCAEAQASGLFLVEHVGPVCVQTPVPTTTQTESATVGVEHVTVTYTAP